MKGHRRSSNMTGPNLMSATAMSIGIVMGHLLHPTMATNPFIFTGSPIDAAPILNERHNPSFKRPHANKAYPTRVNTMLALSSCRPDLNGYFGSVRPGGSGADTTSISYNFQVTWADMNDEKMDNVMRIVDDSVMDAVLAHSFPNVCAFQLDQQKPSSVANGPSQITGLYFGEVSIHAKESCPQDFTPKSRNGGDPTTHHSCRVFEASLKVFGRNTEASADTMRAVLFQAINHDALTRSEKWDVKQILALGASISVKDQDDGGFFSGDNAIFTLILAVSGFAILGACVSVWCLYCCRVSKDRGQSDIEWKGKPSMGDTVTAASTSVGTSLGRNATMDSLVGTVIVGDNSSAYSKRSKQSSRSKQPNPTNSRESRHSLDHQSAPRKGDNASRSGSHRSRSTQRQYERDDEQQKKPLRPSTTNTSEISSVRIDPVHGRKFRKMDQRQQVIVEFAESFDDEYPSSEEESQLASAYLLQDRYASPSDYPPAYLDSDGRYTESQYY